jgi:CBS domain-containing protein
MTTARDIMTKGAECVTETDSLVDAARKMRDLDVGALPICGTDDRLKGMISDRDITVKAVAEQIDLTQPVSTFAQGKPVTIGADDSVDEALRTMAKHKVRRLPVIDGDRLVGIVSQADVARNIDETKTGDLVEAISSTS